jgi:hypothetical protein
LILVFDGAWHRTIDGHGSRKTMSGRHARFCPTKRLIAPCRCPPRTANALQPCWRGCLQEKNPPAINQVAEQAGERLTGSLDQADNVRYRLLSLAAVEPLT